MARAAKLKTEAAEMIESTKSLDCYPADLLERWAAALIVEQRRKAASSYNAAKAEVQRTNSRFDDALNSTGFLPPIIFSPRIADTPKSIEKCVSQLSVVTDARASLLSTRRHFELVGLPFDQVRDNVMRAIGKLAEPPDVARTFRLGKDEAGRRVPREIKWPSRLKPGTHDTFEPDATKILFWICRPQIEKAVLQMLKDAAPSVGMTLEQRTKEIAELDSKLAALEFEESALTWRLMQAGHKVKHRHDMAPAAVLLVDVAFGDPKALGEFG